MLERAVAVFGDPATWVALAGVIVAGAGLWVTFPEAVDRWQDWFTEQGRAAKHRAWRLIALLPGVPGPPDDGGQTVKVGMVVEGNIAMTLPAPTMQARGSVWPRGSSAHTRVETLHRMHIELDKRVEKYHREAQARSREAVEHEADQRRTADARLTRRVADVEEALKAAEAEQVEVNTAGLPVVLLGIVLTALPDVAAIGSWWTAAPVAVGSVGWSMKRAWNIVGDRAEGG